MRLEIQVDVGEVLSIRGNREDTWSRGYLCPKGASLGAVHSDPDRIRRPVIKVDGQWREVSWNDAFRRCTELLTRVSGSGRYRERTKPAAVRQGAAGQAPVAAAARAAVVVAARISAAAQGY